MPHIKNKQYTSFYDLMSSRYNFSDAEINNLLQNFPTLNDYKKLNLKTKLDFVQHFNIKKEDIIKNPRFLFLSTTLVFNKCKLAYALNIEPTPDFLYSYCDMNQVLKNIKAIENGELPKDTDVFKTKSNSNEPQNSNNNPFSVSLEISKLFESRHPDLSAKLKDLFPRYSQKSEDVQNQDTKETDQTPERSKTKEANFSTNSNKNATYSTGSSSTTDHSSNNKIHYKKPSQQTNESLAGIEFSSNNKDQNDNFEPAEEQQPEIEISDYAKTFFEAFAEFSNIPVSLIEEKYRLYSKEFTIEEEGVFAKLQQHSSKFITAPTETILHAKKLLEEIGFSVDVIHDYVLLTPEFPYISDYIDSIKEKVQLLNSLNIPNEYIALNFNILRYNIRSLELKTKLAFINDLPIETFLIKGYMAHPSAVWARMKAYEKGLIPSNQFYADYRYNNNQSQYRTGELIDMFPLTEADIETINQQVYNLLDNGYTWRNSYKYYQKFYEKQDESNKNLENATNETDISENENYESVNTEPKDINTEESRSLIQELKDFAEEESKQKSHIENENNNNINVENVDDKIMLKLMNLFDCSDEEVKKFVKKRPSLLRLDFNKVNVVKEHLFNTLNLTADEFAAAIKVNPSLTNKSIRQYDAYRTFLSDYMLFDKKQIKEAIINSGNAIIKDPEEVLEKTNIFAKTLQIPFKRAAQIFIESPAAYLGRIEKLEERLRTLLSLGIDKEILVSNLNIASCTNKNVKIKYMLAKLNGLSDEEFLKRNYFVNEAKVYARTMFNVTYEKELPVYDCEKFFKRNLEEFFSDKSRRPSFVDEDEPSLALKEIFPFGEIQKKEIEKLYNQKFHKNPLKLNEEELTYGN